MLENNSIIARGTTNLVYNRIEPKLSDYMGEQDKDTALFAECKWTNEKVDLNVLETLAKHSRLFPYKNVHLYLFSNSGFTKGCIDEANRMGNVALVSYADIVAQ